MLIIRRLAVAWAVFFELLLYVDVRGSRPIPRLAALLVFALACRGGCWTRSVKVDDRFMRVSYLYHESELPRGIFSTKKSYHVMRPSFHFGTHWVTDLRLLIIIKSLLTSLRTATRTCVEGDVWRE